MPYTDFCQSKYNELYTEAYTNIKEFGSIIDWPYEVE